MAKMTLLEMVQDILNDMDSDEVNSIDDTIEALQVAQIIKTTYFALMSSRNWPHLRKPIQAIASNSFATPTHMSMRGDVKELVFLNYNVAPLGVTRKNYKEMQWRDPDVFLMSLNKENTDADNIDIIRDPSGIELAIRNDAAPKFYTSFDDLTMVFDSYDRDTDTVLQASKIQAVGYVMPTFDMEDDHYPDLPEEATIALLEEAKSRASMKLRQITDAKSEQEAGRQHRWLSRKAWKVQGGLIYPDYGRKRGRGSNPYFDKTLGKK